MGSTEGKLLLAVLQRCPSLLPSTPCTIDTHDHDSVRPPTTPESAPEQATTRSKPPERSRPSPPPSLPLPPCSPAGPFEALLPLQHSPRIQLFPLHPPTTTRRTLHHHQPCTLYRRAPSHSRPLTRSARRLSTTVSPLHSLHSRAPRHQRTFSPNVDGHTLCIPTNLVSLQCTLCCHFASCRTLSSL